MRIRDAFGIYHVLEKRIRASGIPLTCVDLFDDPEVKTHVDNVNRLSDYLGHMYRRGLLSRIPAPKSINSQAKWAYTWKDQPTMMAIPSRTTPHLVTKSTTLLQKPNITITEDGGIVVIDLPQLTLTIRTK